MDAKRESETTAMKNRTTVERKSDRELVVTRTFNGPARIVFEAWTKPELFKRWWVPKSMGMSLLSCEMDVRVGGTYRLEFATLTPAAWRSSARYIEVIPHSRLVWTNEEGGEGGAVTTVTFEEKVARRCWSCTSSIPRRKLSTLPAPGRRMRWSRRSSNWTTFSSPWARAWDGHETVYLLTEGKMTAPASITITPVLVADLLAEGERMPVYVHVIDHPDARVLVDTGMTELHPAAADLDPRLRPLSKQNFDLAGIDIVVNTHLHFDHCGGNHLFAGRPIYVQRRELDDARNEDDYTIREWVEAPGVRYVPVDGELELLRGLRLVPAPGHTRGMQVVVVETGDRPVVVGGDVAVWFGELDEPHTEGQMRVRALDPELVWLAHEHQPWRPSTVADQPSQPHSV